MRGFWLWALASLAAGLPLPTLAADAAQKDVSRSVVHVFATQLYPDLGRPWLKVEPREAVASGVVIDGKHVLTTAYNVVYASQVQVQLGHAPLKLAARVVALAPSIDLALLEVDEKALESVPPVPRSAELPKARDQVTVYGFAVGGTALSVTRGIVSRFEFTFNGDKTDRLLIQIDAALNTGNSGGPAMAGGKMIGLAYSRLEGSDNIGYIIPTEEVELFLADLADGRYDGKPALFDEFQNADNPALRQMLKLPEAVGGAVVRRPFDAAAAYPLKRWDVVAKIGDYPVGRDQTVQVRDGVRLDFRYLVPKLARNGKVRLTILRGGRESVVEVPLRTEVDWLVPPLGGRPLSYFLFGPVVFCTAAYEYLSWLGADSITTFYPSWSSHLSPLVARGSDRQRVPGEELVLVPGPFLPSRLTKGYGTDRWTQVVSEVNGVKIRNLRHLVETIRDSREKFVVIRLAEIDSEDLVLDRAEVLRATEGIMVDNGIRQQASDDLLRVWQGAK